MECAQLELEPEINELPKAKKKSKDMAAILEKLLPNPPSLHRKKITEVIPGVTFRVFFYEATWIEEQQFTRMDFHSELRTRYYVLFETVTGYHAVWSKDDVKCHWMAEVRREYFKQNKRDIEDEATTEDIIADWEQLHGRPYAELFEFDWIDGKPPEDSPEFGMV